MTPVLTQLEPRLAAYGIVVASRAELVVTQEVFDRFSWKAGDRTCVVDLSDLKLVSHTPNQ